MASFIEHVLCILCSPSLTEAFDGEQYSFDLQLVECKYFCKDSGLTPFWPSSEVKHSLSVTWLSPAWSLNGNEVSF